MLSFAHRLALSLEGALSMVRAVFFYLVAVLILSRMMAKSSEAKR